MNETMIRYFRAKLGRQSDNWACICIARNKIKKLLYYPLCTDGHYFGVRGNLGQYNTFKDFESAFEKYES